MQTKTSRHPCPRCGQRLTIEDASGPRRLFLRALMLRIWRCTPECGWRGLRFSISLFRQGKNRLRKVILAVLFGVGCVFAVRYALSRAPERSMPTGDENIHEVAE
jgi:hypothetical protein